MSETWRRRLSEAAKKRWESSDERQRMRKLKLGGSLTEGHKKHISTSVKKMWEERHRNGYQHPEESRKRMAASVRRNVKSALASGAFVKALRRSCKQKEPLFEKEFCRCLRKLHICYRSQVPLLNRFVVDILLLDFKTIIECDGSYWHSFPSIQKKDKRRDLQLQQAGFRVFRVPESKFKRDYMGAAKWALDRLKIPF